MSTDQRLLVQLEAAWPPARWQRERVVVAVSGGPDSVALLRAMLALRGGSAGLVVAHFNHQLRGAESDADEAFVRDLAERLGVECEVGRVSEFGAAPPRSAADARRLRYPFLADRAARHAARSVAVAHTADDQAETILQRIVRGTGIEGLRGIPPRRRLNEAVMLVRPMLQVTRATVLGYLASLDQPFREDSSNRAQLSTRSRLRYGLLPLLEREYNPRVVEALLRLGEQAAQLHAQLEAQGAAALAECAAARDSAWEIDCRRLAAYSAPVVRTCLAALWRQSGWPEQAMGQREWKSLHALATGDGRESRRRDFPGAVDAWRDGPILRLQRRSTFVAPITLEV